jgi:hypothetical protein
VALVQFAVVGALEFRLVALDEQEVVRFPAVLSPTAI